MNKGKIDRVLQLIKNDKTQENHLFRTLAITGNPFPLLKPLKDAGYFSPDKNPGPVELTNQKGHFTVPHWNILDYLENVAKHNKQNLSKNITDSLLEIINQIIEHKTVDGKRIDNDGTDWMLTKILFLLPLDQIEASHFNFLKTALKSTWGTTLISSEMGNSILPALLKYKSKDLVLNFLEVLFEYKTMDDNSLDQYMSLVDQFWLNEAIKHHKQSIAELCSLEAAEVVINRINAILSEDRSQFSDTWIRTIENHPQTRFPERYECQLVYFIRDMFELSEIDIIAKATKVLLEKKHPIFKRLALHIINFHYKGLKKIFWDWSENPLNEIFVKHELYELIKANCRSFTKKQKNLVTRWIEEKDYYISDEIKEKKELVEKIVAYEKKEWLSALLDTKDQDIIELYNKYHSINSAKLDHPGFDSWSETLVGTISPVGEVDLLSKSNNEIIHYLNSFKEKNGWKTPTVDGLANTLKRCVLTKPQKFTNNIKLFLSVKPAYKHALLRGFSEAWLAQKNIEWESLFLFISDLLEDSSFWDEECLNQRYDYKNMIVSQIADLISDGTKKDNHAFEPEHLPVAEEILLLLASKAESNLQERRDIVNAVLNSVRGTIFTAMINYSLRYARLFLKNKPGKWVSSIKKDFTSRLDERVELSLDFPVVIGEYLPNLYYLDSKWVVDNIDKIFLKNNEKRWSAAFTGYLFHASSVYSYFYELLTKNKHYEKALNTKFEDDHITERVAQHICVAYLEGWEKLEDEDSLISKLISNDDPKQLSAIISFFWMQRNHLTEKIKNSIKPLWKKMYLHLQQKSEIEEYQRLISNMIKWLVLVDEIDNDIFEWIKSSVQYIESNFNSSFFIEYLLKHVEKTPAKVAFLYIEMLNQDFYPRFKEEYILKIITKLNSHNHEEDAIKICNSYLNKGFEFTRTVLELIHAEK